MSQAKQQFRSIKQRLFTYGNPVSGIRAFFNSESIDTIQKYAEKLAKEPYFRSAFVGKGFPTKIVDINHCGNMPLFSELEKTLLWYTLSLFTEAKRINQFLEVKTEYEKIFLLGEYDDCLNMLDEIHKQYGYSFWEIRNRIAVLNERDRLDSQKKYTNGVITELASGSVFAYAINSYSKKCERNISIGAFYNMIGGDFSRFASKNVPELLCQYAKYKAGGSVSVIGDEDIHLNIDTINYFLCFDDKCPIIDRFLSFRDIASSLFISGKNEIFSRLIPFLKKLNSVINDPFLENTCYLWERDFYPFHPLDNEDICSVFDLYSKGKYAECAQLSKSLLIKKVTYFPLIEVFVKSNIYLAENNLLIDGNCVLDRIAHKLRQLFARLGDIKDIYADLVKILYIHLDTNWAMELLLIVEKYFNKLTVLEESKLYSVYSSISLPEEIFSFDAKYLPEYLDSSTDIYRDNVATQLAIAVRTNNFHKIDSLEMDYLRKQKYKARLVLETDPNCALEAIDDILSNEVNNGVYLEICALQVKALLRTQRLLDAITVFVNAFLENSNFVYIGSIDWIFRDIKSGEYDVRGSILVPIICIIYFNYYPGHDDGDDIVLSVCYDEYLESLGVEKPSDLLSDYPLEVDESLFIRFLAEVCVPSVMERSLAFATDDDILRERNVICEALADRDPANREKYKEEIRRHTNTLLVRLAKREIETGKIYIDSDAVRMLLAQEVCEPFERYIEHRNNNLEEQFFEILNQITNKDTDKSIYLVRHVKQTEMLEEIVKKARDIFVADNKYGLDGCLSVRIRHGTLESQLRSCFEKHKLITTKAVDGTYNHNPAWIIDPFVNASTKEQIDSIFTRFSEKVDMCILNLKKELIQIRTESKNSKGLFNFTIDADSMTYIEAEMYSIESFEEFEQLILDIMMNTAEVSLNTVREFLARDINEIFQEALSDLAREIQQFQNEINIQGLRDQIANARTDISTELKTIAEWFRLSQPDAFIDYDMALASQISYSTFQHSHPSCSLECRYDKVDRSFMLKGRTLRCMVDILIILLDNVVKHSGLANSVSADICAAREGNIVILSVSNPVTSNAVSLEQLTEIMGRLDDWEKQGYTSREGGSGLHKIKKILSVDLQCQNTLELTCADDIFCVKISADLGGVIL